MKQYKCGIKEQLAFSKIMRDKETVRWYKESSWLKYMPSWVFYKFLFAATHRIENDKIPRWSNNKSKYGQRFPKWDKEPGGKGVAAVKLTITRGSSDTSAESRVMATKFDDIARRIFYYADHTSDHLPFVNEGETYWSEFYFASRYDAELFHSMYGGELGWTETD